MRNRKPKPVVLVSVSTTKVSEKDAVTLCAYHLAMAAAFFEATPKNTKALHDQISIRLDGVYAKAAGDFVRKLNDYHKSLDSL